MNRVEILREHIDAVLRSMTDAEERRHAYVHLYGVAQACALIALKRGEDAELAVMAGMLHDFCSYAKMDKRDHAHKSAVLARDVLSSLGIASDGETDKICGAIYTHSEKATAHPAFAEVLIDADVLQHCLYNPSQEVMAHETARYEKLKREFDLM